MAASLQAFPQLAQALRAVLQQHQAQPRQQFWLAFSGGLDSTVLLHGLCQSGFPVNCLRPVHVNHGIAAAAAAWQQHCEAQCVALGVHCLSLQTQVAPGAGLEARARTARYALFTDCLGAGETLLTAHHQDDQIETLLLRLLTRGSGAAGLAGMPARRALGLGQLWRPLLAVPRTELLAYAQAQGLQWLEDPSNQDLEFDRNQLRHQVLPALQARWPQARAALAAAAVHLQEDAELVELALAAQLAGCAAGTGDIMQITALLAQPQPLRLLRYWLARAGCHDLSDAYLGEILRQLQAKPDRQPSHRVAAELSLRRHRDGLHLVPAAAVAPYTALHWSVPAPLVWSAGCLTATPAAGAGLRPDIQRVVVQPATAADRILLPQGERAVQGLLARAGVPPWLRPLWPRLWWQQRLVAVPGIAVAADALATQDGWQLAWQPARLALAAAD